jgi:hypothetical protein
MGETDPNLYPCFISLQTIKSLISGDSVAVRIKNFCSKRICDEISKKLQTHPSVSSFNKANEIGRIGMAHFEIDGPEKFLNYHENALENTEKLRDIFSPYLSPIDKLRVILDEKWPAGAMLETLYGRKCFVGICRIMQPSIELLAHNDRLDRDSPDSIQAKSLLGQLSACIYLQIPEEGGQLRLWMKEPESEEKYFNLIGNNYGVQLEKLGLPKYEIFPEQGELIIFNTRRYHGVAPGRGRPRINVGLFIGYRSDYTYLSYWS